MKAAEAPATTALDAPSGRRQCRFCGAELRRVFVDLGMSPLANSYLTEDQLGSMEPFYPLRVWVCGECFLVQLDEFASPESIFGDYAYFSSYSDSWLCHCRAYAEKMIQELGLGRDSQVVELASNDGYLLQFFQRAGVPVLGVEPAGNVAQAALEKGIPTSVEFFGREVARQMSEEDMRADLLIGNNVLAHVPKLNDFVAGMKLLLAPGGTITLEFPHLLRLIEKNQFDTIYHEHFSYFSLRTARRVFSCHGLTIFDVKEIEVHGGSLRVYARHSEDGWRAVADRVQQLEDREEGVGLFRLETYECFAQRVRKARCDFLSFLTRVQEKGLSVVGYGAPAKGNTLLNYCRVGPDLIQYTVDRSLHKQGCYLPGSHIPIFHPDKIRQTRPDYVLILPWNLKAEIMEQMAFIREWRGRFLVPIPRLEILA